MLRDLVSKVQSCLTDRGPVQSHLEESIEVSDFNFMFVSWPLQKIRGYDFTSA